MKLKKTNSRLFVETQNGEEVVHVIHCGKTLSEIKEDVATAYLVAEAAGNFARLHVLTSWSEDEALQDVYEYLCEEEGDENPQLIGVFKLTL